MREYGQIQCSFWTDPDIRSLSEDARLLAAYLLTGPHSNGLGCYYLPFAYLQGDFGWPEERVSKGFTELSRNPFAKHCKTTNFVLIPKFLHWNPIANGNIAKARVTEFHTVPKTFQHFNELVTVLKRFGNHWGNPFETLLQTLSKPLNETQEPEPDPIRPDPTQPDLTLPGSPPDAGGLNGKGTFVDQAKEVFEFLNSKTGKTFRAVNPDGSLTTSGTHVVSLLKKGFEYRDFKIVIARKYRQWTGDDRMEQYLRPKTLFLPSNFVEYRGETDAEV